MLRVSDELKIFGKVMQKIPSAEANVFHQDYGVLRFGVYEYNGTVLQCHIWVGTTCIASTDGCGTREKAIEWLESEARRIMRECLEIATGPVLVGATQPPTDDCVVVTTDEQYREVYGKPMPEWMKRGPAVFEAK